MARTRSRDNPMSPEGCFIKYRLELLNIKYEDIAKKAHRSTPFVSQVICGVRRSEKVESALAALLGFATFKELIYAARQQSKGVPA